MLFYHFIYQQPHFLPFAGICHCGVSRFLKTKITMQENNSIIIAMLEELLTISKSQRPEQTVNANVD